MTSMCKGMVIMPVFWLAKSQRPSPDPRICADVARLKGIVTHRKQSMNDHYHMIPRVWVQHTTNDAKCNSPLYIYKARKGRSVCTDGRPR